MCAHKAKGEVYRTTIRPTLLYGHKCRASRNDHSTKIKVTEMQMF